MSCFKEDDYLLLSGIQHFAFCRRQWALIHIEQQWAENLRTIEGEILHEKAHNPYHPEKRGDIIVSRGMPVFSRTMGVSGICDIVELHRNPSGISLFGRDGLFLPVPVEYKRGSPKETDEDILQLTAQAICLEEMLACHVPEGYLFYGEINRRVKIFFDDETRQRVIELFHEMHRLYERQYTPKVKTGKHCRACSLANVCLPKLCQYKYSSVSDYIQSRMEEKL
ncbi:MAG: CRISPR-associated protein Cas4 [Oscillospiraceae bacterium]